MDFHEALEKLRAHNDFLQWEKENPQHYLAHGFLMKGNSVIEEWQIGFYNKHSDRIVVFTIGDDITQNPPSELFKKESRVQELTLQDVKTTAPQALEAAEAYRAEHYKAHTPRQTIVLLQRLASGQIWNITYVTDAFSVCNIKLDTRDLSVTHASCESLMGWGSAEKGERKH